MVVRNAGGFSYGYSGITEIGGRHSEALMDFGIVRLRAGESHQSSSGRERALLILSGTLDLSWDGRTTRVSRGSYFDEAPWCLSLSAGSEALLTADRGVVTIHESVGPRVSPHSRPSTVTSWARPCDHVHPPCFPL